jgi:hypothetical protein
MQAFISPMSLSVEKATRISGLPPETRPKSCSILTSITSWQELSKVGICKSKSEYRFICFFLDMQRFQVPYNLKAIPEVQEYLNGAFEKAKHHGDLQDLYRRRFVFDITQLLCNT